MCVEYKYVLLCMESGANMDICLLCIRSFRNTSDVSRQWICPNKNFLNALMDVIFMLASFSLLRQGDMEYTKICDGACGCANQQVIQRCVRRGTLRSVGWSNQFSSNIPATVHMGTVIIHHLTELSNMSLYRKIKGAMNVKKPTHALAHIR